MNGNIIISQLHCEFLFSVYCIILHSTHGDCVLQNTLIACLFVRVFVDTKKSSLSEAGQFMSSTYYVPV